MKTLFSRFVKDESGATAIEYGLIAAGISVAIIAVVQGLGTNLKTTFSSVSTALKYASNSVLREGSGRTPGPFRFAAAAVAGSHEPRSRSVQAGRQTDDVERCHAD